MSENTLPQMPAAMREALDRLSEAASDVPRWKPEPGDTIYGRIEDQRFFQGKRGDLVPVVKLLTEAGPTELTLWHKVLLEELLGQECQIGDLVVVRFEGLQQGRSRSFYGYRVAVQQEGPRDPQLMLRRSPDEAPVVREKAGDTTALDALTSGQGSTKSPF